MQVPITGVAVMVAVPGLLAAKALIFPEPDNTKPMPGLLFTQFTVAVGSVVKVKGPAFCPLHILVLAGTVTSGVGFTNSGLVTTVEPHSLVAVS